MRILVTNDDGYNAYGLICLARALSKNHEVTVAAPASQRSACSHSLTIRQIVSVNRMDVEGLDCECYAVNGTPADCVKIVMERPEFKKPDIVVSGINHGPNVASDIHYSGTVGGALEGSLYGLRSFALSLNASESVHFEDAARLAAQLIFLDYSGIPKSSVININFPDVPAKEYAGIVVAKQGVAEYEDAIVLTGENAFMISGRLKRQWSEDTDIKMLNDHYVVITPILCDMTDYPSIGRLNETLGNFGG